MKPKKSVSIDQLERLVDDESVVVEILPNGDVQVDDRDPRELEELLTRRAKLGGTY